MGRQLSGVIRDPGFSLSPLVLSCASGLFFTMWLQELQPSWLFMLGPWQRENGSLESALASETTSA